MQVHADMGRELLEKRASILNILAKSPHAMELWQIWERGYMFVILDISDVHVTYDMNFLPSGWHLAQDRYKLKDLSLWMTTDVTTVTCK